MQFNLHLFGVNADQNAWHGYVPAPFGALAAHKVAGTGSSVFDLAGGGNLDPFAKPFMCLLLRHFNQAPQMSLYKPIRRKI